MKNDIFCMFLLSGCDFIQYFVGPSKALSFPPFVAASFFDRNEIHRIQNEKIVWKIKKNPFCRFSKKDLKF